MASTNGKKLRVAAALNAPSAIACVEIRGARQNNLKGFDLDLPLGKLTVVTGPSGSGKSSLAFDTIYAEGQRRYVETFSPYTRQFLERMDKPQVDEIRGIPPAIAIEQSNPVKSSRSTVGTMTEINDYLKLLLPRVAHAFCPNCGREIQPETAKSIADHLLRLTMLHEDCYPERSAAERSPEVEGSRGAGEKNWNETRDDSPGNGPNSLRSVRNDVLITFWVAVPAKTPPEEFFQFLQQQGYLRIWSNGEIIRVDNAPKNHRLGARVQVIQDRLTIKEEDRARLVESLETALRFGKDRVNVILLKDGSQLPFSTGWHCAHCDLDIRPPTPGLFSFNNPLGACPECRGFGRTIAIDLNRAIPDRALSIAQGAVRVFRGEEMGESQKDLMRACAREEIDVHIPFEELPRADQDFVINGEKSIVAARERGESFTEEDYEQDRWYGVRGFFRWLESKTYKMHVRVLLSRYRAYTTCPSCQGGRFQPETLNHRLVRQDGIAFTLPEFAALPISEARDFLASLTIPPHDSAAEMLRAEIASRLSYLCGVGVGYLTLDRATRTLSGGEVQRVNLTTCLGASLVNTLFVMDEPSVGLHPRDVGRLIRVMHNLRDKGNTLLVVEHEEAIIRAADHLLDIGPGRGEKGGELVFQGTLAQMLGREPAEIDEEVVPGSRTSKTSNASAGLQASGKSSSRQNGSTRRREVRASRADSLTAEYLSRRRGIPVPGVRRQSPHALKIKGATQHNLKGIEVDIPLGVFTCVTGVSGSGKSTLVHEVLYQNLLRARGSGTEEAGACKSVTGIHRLGEIVMVDQSPLSRTPRSTPILYLGIYDRVRELFAAQPEAMAQGLTASAFSFNSGGGRCERCGGTGFEKIEMQFLSDLYVRCAECEGRRFQPHVLKVKLRGHSIHDLLEMTVSEAIAFFGSLGENETLARPLGVLEEVGLGYLGLGQPLNTLSGGESQRLKLVRHLTESANDQAQNNALFIFDEPTTGLHFDDVAMLVKLFQRLVESGNSILVIEHNLEVIKCADWVIDLGPEGGEEGGRVVAVGTPENLTRREDSHTGRHLRAVLPGEAQRSGGGPLNIPDALLGRGSAGSLDLAQDDEVLRAAEDPPRYGSNGHRRSISIHGAREHNLRNLSLAIPRDQLVVITGLSGSGKSTVAFDLLFAEGQRRFLDSMSPYARQFVEQLEKPDVDLIEGLPPTVAIEQRVTRGGGKSTVATVTEVYHFLRLLFAKTGTQFCPDCDLPVEKQSLAAIVRQLETAARRGPLTVLAPLVKARKGFHTEVARWAERQGFEMLYVDGRLVPISEFKKLERFKEHTISAVVGTIDKKRILKARHLMQRALEIGRGTAHLLDAKNRLTTMSTEMSCPGCGRAFEELDPRLFSFNSPHGWCETCSGFGEIWNVALQHGDPESGESRLESELDAEKQFEEIEEEEARPCPDCHGARLNAIARHVRVQGLTIDDFDKRSAGEALKLVRKLRFRGNQNVIAQDLIPEIEQRLRFMENVGLGYLALGRSAKTLSGGESQRIRLAAQLGSNLRGVLYVLDEPTIGLHARDNLRLLETLAALREKGNSLVIVEHDEETMRRADHIIDLGPGAGVHGGKLVAQGSLGEIERNAQSQTGRCLRTPLCHPVRKVRRSLGEVEQWLEVHGAEANNLKKIEARFPIGRLSVISGISGSGKSTLMRSVLLPAVAAACDRRGRKQNRTVNADQGAPLQAQISGAEAIETVYEVDQSPIGKTSRSTPATYIKLLDEIRNLFAQLPVSRVRGYSASRFSFNMEGGRCETCAGQGVIKLEMSFLPNSYMPCEDCGGKRYNPQTLEVLYHERSIGDVLDMTIAEAAEFFAANPKIACPLSLLAETGLGYLKLGQPSPTLSGGEAQRLKLATKLTRGVSRAANERLRKMRKPKSTLYLLEEPTIGLHMADVELLLNVLHRLVDEGNTVIVIEHNLSVIAEADYVLDLGPEAGSSGGEIVAAGPPEQVAKNRLSRTAPFLRDVLARSRATEKALSS